MDQLRFKNNQFKIMQVADAQELPVPSPDTARLLQMAIAAEQPDLVLFTGDQIYGIHPALWGKQPQDRVRGVSDVILRPVVDAGVPFAVTYGNHDAECGLPNRALAELYADYPGYVPGERRCPDDPGTFRLPLYGADGSIKHSVYAFDTHGSAPSGGGAGLTEEQLLWFREQRASERPDGQTAPRALVFQHIPVPEYYNVINRDTKRTRGSVEAFGRRKGEFYSLPEALKAAGGFLKETPSVTRALPDEFAALLEDGGVLALSAGHDHNNSFVADWQGIRLIYTQGAGFHVYGPGLKRGVRIFTLREDAPDTFTTYTRTWESLTDEKPEQALLAWALAHTPSSVAQAKAWAKRALPFAAAGVLAAGAGVGHAVRWKKI